MVDPWDIHFGVKYVEDKLDPLTLQPQVATTGGMGGDGIIGDLDGLIKPRKKSIEQFDLVTGLYTVVDVVSIVVLLIDVCGYY